MADKTFSIIHNLDGLDKPTLKKYLDDMSTYIGLDPALNGLDTIYMDDPQGGGRSLVPYARRGTCEILRNLYEVEVESLTYATVSGSIIFTATGRAKKRGNRQEIAIGSKFIEGLREKTLDNAVMTASTRALQRLTMQFTELGILAESEVVGLVGQAPNPAGSAQLADNPLPPTFLPPPAVPANNAPGKLVETKSEEKPVVAPPIALDAQFTGQQSHIDAAWQQVAAKEADKKAAETSAPAASAQPTSPSESTVTSNLESAKQPDIEPDKTPAEPGARPKRASRRKANTVALDVEPETVHKAAPNAGPVPITAPTVSVNPSSAQQVVPAPPQSPAPEPPKATTAPAPQAPPPAASPAAPVAGMPTEAQMSEYRKKINVYTVQLPPSQDLGPTQKMRAFITKLSGNAPQEMTVDQWSDVIAFFDSFVERNPNIKNLIKYIDDMLGVK